MIPKIYQLLKWIFILPVKIYQITISPWMPDSCRHSPTCSQYAIEAIQIHGIFIGIWLGTKKLIKCHPWGTSGYDPVPPKGSRKKTEHDNH